MEPIQYKINLVQRYILEKTGKRITIKFDGYNHNRQLDMLEQAYSYALKEY